VAQFLPDGKLDPTFGSGGYVIHTAASKPSDGNPDAGPGNIPYGEATAISVAKSGEVFVFGFNSLVHVEATNTLIALRANGSLDPAFGQQGVVTTDLHSNLGGLMIPTADGHLLLGSNVDFMGCADFSIEKYRSSGVRDQSFTTVHGGDYYISTRIPGYQSAQLVTLLTLPSGDFVALVHAANSCTPGNFYTYAAVLVRYHPNGSIDRTLGKNGIVKLPGLGNPQVQPGAVGQPDGGVVVALAGSSGLSLLSISPTARVDKQVPVPSVGLSPSIAVGDAGRGKVLIVSDASGQWSVARFLGAGS
jgi:hypothetical protein